MLWLDHKGTFQSLTGIILYLSNLGPRKRGMQMKATELKVTGLYNTTGAGGLSAKGIELSSTDLLLN